MRVSYFSLFSLLLVAFVLEFSLGIRLTQIDGLSLKNLAIFALLMLWVVGNAAKGKPILQSGPVTVPVILFIVYSTLSLVATAMLKVIPGYSLMQEVLFFKGTMDPYILLLITYSMTHDAVTVRRLLTALLVVMAVFLAITLLGSLNLIHVGRVSLSDHGRTSGAFSEKNQFALYLVTFMPLVGAFLFRARSKAIKTALIALLLASAYVMLLTVSRGGFVSLVVGGGAYYFLYSKKPVVTRMLAVAGIYFAGIIVLAGLVMILPETTSGRLIDKLTGNFMIGAYGDVQDYSSGRLSLWTSSLGHLITNPHKLLTGTGWRTFIPMFGGNSHNEYILYLVSTGLIGLFLFLWIFVRLIKSVLIFRKEDPHNVHFYNAFLSSMVAYLTGLMFVNIFNPAYFVLIYSALILKLGIVQSRDSGRAVSMDTDKLEAKARILRRRTPVEV